MSALDPTDPGRGEPWPRSALALAPALAALAYPFWLKGFHWAVSAPGGAPSAMLTSMLLLAAFSSPALGLAFALRSAGPAPGSRFQLRARRLACLSVATPPLFVLLAFILSVLGRPLPEDWAWGLIWSAAGLWVWLGRGGKAPTARSPPDARLRVTHGVVAAIVVAYVLFHLANHLFGLVGPEAHHTVMKLGRRVYRAAAIEPLLVAFLLCQVASGGWLAWRWIARPIDRYRAFQIASGLYLWCFIVTHMNSALVSARLMHKIDTGWDWASGAPTGLIQDAWSIRLVPHYALGVFFVLSHLVSGLRGVSIAHGIDATLTNRAWSLGLLASAIVSAAIVAGLCGLRI